MKAQSRFLCLFLAAVFLCALPAGAGADGPMVKALPAPQKLIISPEDRTVEKGEMLQLTAAPLPAGTDPAVTWSSGDIRVASVDATGLVTARKVGKVKITATSKAKKSVYTVRTLNVVDTKTVTGVTLESDGSVLLVGGTLALTAHVLPETAPQEVTWLSDNPAVADVSPAGLVTGHQLGSATITASAGDKSAQQRVVVLGERPVSEVPPQVTSVAGIGENLSKIDDVMRCATVEVDALRVSGAIGEPEANARKIIIVNAFRMARFPWMSAKPVTYWSGGARYTPNVVYYGLPYTQRNRTFNVNKVLKVGAFKMLGSDRHYTAYLPNMSYPGNDCSAFVSISIWGLGKSHSLLRSRDIKVNSAYRTVASHTNLKGYQQLRPGDLIVKSGHVVLFLYYTNSFRSQIMIIQQGGRPALNTVGCAVKPLSYYSGDSAYIARRRRPFA